MKNKFVYLGFLWFLLAVFYGFQYFIRISPCILSDHLCDQFCLSASQFSMFPAFYLYGYGFSQIFIGYFLDHKGFAKTMSCSIFVCALAALLFFISDTLWVKYAARLAMGIGASGGLIAPLKFVGDRMPDGKKGLFNGLTLTIGTLGALLAENILSLTSNESGAFFNVGVMLFLLAVSLSITMFLAFKNIDKKTNLQERFPVPALMSAVKNKRLFLYAFLTFSCFAPLAVFVDSWGLSLVISKLNITKSEASSIVSYIFYGLLFGSLVLPGFFERFTKIHLGIKIKFFCSVIILISLLFIDFESVEVVKFLLFCIGFLASAEMLCFTAASNCVQEKIRGISLGLVNSINMVGSGILQQVIGFLMDVFWDGSVSSSNTPLYTYDVYQKAFLFIVFLYALSFFLSAFLLKKES